MSTLRNLFRRLWQAICERRMEAEIAAIVRADVEREMGR